MNNKIAQVYIDYMNSHQIAAKDIISFITESNKIEGIIRYPLMQEIQALETFLNLESLYIFNLKAFVSRNQIGAVLRDREGMDVRIGNYHPPKGGSEIKDALQRLLNDVSWYNIYNFHSKYESLHPFTDCNGRSGRAIWAWQMVHHNLSISLGFLHTYYYQSLDPININ